MQRLVQAQPDSLPRSLSVPVEPVKAAGLTLTESPVGAGVAAGAAVYHVTAADGLEKRQEREKEM